ncbi:hypothetical protein ANN_21981 [Periplaneta americana]|uniref:Uncharacterized protein n=1 Tax=Periplaneta americana TaxID=6978 RepID=A0ABQ8S6V4_PERAM|nr:hypothetical protein ANN_21981 [Periplaneta americana]
MAGLCEGDNELASSLKAIFGYLTTLYQLTTRLFCVDGISDSEMVFDEIFSAGQTDLAPGTRIYRNKHGGPHSFVRDTALNFLWCRRGEKREVIMPCPSASKLIMKLIYFLPIEFCGLDKARNSDNGCARHLRP